MNFQEIYYLRDGNARGALVVRPQREIADPRALAKGQIVENGPVSFEYAAGRTPMDLIGTGYAALYVVSDRVIELLACNKVTGWTTFGVKVYGKGHDEIPGYSGLCVTGKCGRIDNSKSTAVWRESPAGERRKVWAGLYFDTSSWDGSDMFCPENTGHVFIGKWVKELLENGSVTNVQFTRLTDVERLMLV